MERCIFVIPTRASDEGSAGAVRLYSSEHYQLGLANLQIPRRAFGALGMTSVRGLTSVLATIPILLTDNHRPFTAATAAHKDGISATLRGANTGEHATGERDRA